MLFPQFTNKTDRSGRSIAFPAICKIPAPPAPFAPAPYPSEHGRKLANARKVVIQAKSDLEKKSKGSRSSGNEPGVQKGIVSMKNIEQLILKHEGELKKAPRLNYDSALKIQRKFEQGVEREVKELEKVARNDRELQAVVKRITQVVGKAARAV